MPPSIDACSICWKRQVRLGLRLGDRQRAVANVGHDPDHLPRLVADAGRHHPPTDRRLAAEDLAGERLAQHQHRRALGPVEGGEHPSAPEAQPHRVEIARTDEVDGRLGKVQGVGRHRAPASRKIVRLTFPPDASGKRDDTPAASTSARSSSRASSSTSARPKSRPAVRRPAIASTARPPESLADSRTAELIEGVCDVDLDALDVKPALGGRRPHLGDRPPGPVRGSLFSPLTASTTSHRRLRGAHVRRAGDGRAASRPCGPSCAGRGSRA